MTIWHNSTISDVIITIADGNETQSHIVHAGEDLELDARFDEQATYYTCLERKGAPRRSVTASPEMSVEPPSGVQSYPRGLSHGKPSKPPEKP
jgi:hypothetical protein